MIQDPGLILAYLAGVVGLVFQVSRVRALAPLFDRLPALVWTYFLPMLSTSVGILPSSSPLYAALARYLLPASLVLMLLSADLRSIARLGRTALVVMLAGCLGIMLGALLGYAVLRPWLPDEAWKAVGALTATWTGGSANLVAVATTLGLSPELQGVIIIVDTVVGYSWMGLLIWLAGQQPRVDRWLGADRSEVAGLGARLAERREAGRRPLGVPEVTLMVALAIGLTMLCLHLGTRMPPLGRVLNAFSWAVLILTTVSLLLSLTRLARLEEAGASTLGYAGFYLLLASVGAQGDLRKVVSHPQFVLLGVIVIAVHAAVTLLAVRLLRAPVFFFGAASQACLGGYSSAPVVAAIYEPAMAPLGLLLAVLGNLGGTYLGLLTAQLIAPVMLLATLALAAVDTLVVGILADPVSLDPHRATDLVSAAIVSNVCDPLVRYRSDGSRPEPVLATTWATTDARHWTFTLRPGVRFHDGSPLDADAVVANLESLRQRRLFGGRAERVGPLVVSLALDRPNSALLATLSQPFFSMQSPRELQAGSSRPVGTGPFRLVTGRPGEIRLEAEASHWAGAPRLRRLVFRRLPDEDSLVRALLAGDVDVTSAVGQERVNRLHDRPEITLDSQIGLNIAFLSINNDRAPFDDPRVRQALARAVDREALVDGILAGHGEPARNPLPPHVWGYAARSRELILDRPTARRLLADAGHPAGLETTLLTVQTTRPYLPAPMRLAERLQAELAEIGVRLKLRQVPSWSHYIDQTTRGDYDLAMLGWQADTTDPNDFLSALLASEAIGSTNRSRYRSQAMDGLLKQGRRASDPGERAAIYRQAQDLFQKDMPWVPLYHVSAFTAYRRSVHGLSVGPTGVLRYEKAWKTE